MRGGFSKLVVASSVCVLASCYQITQHDPTMDASTPDACGTGCASQPDAASASSWQCWDLEDGSTECALDEEEVPGDGWACHFENAPDDDGGDDAVVCVGPPGEEPESGDFECVDEGDAAVCRDDDPSYPDPGGEEKWDCYFDEFGNLVCTTGDLEEETPDPPCEPGSMRWCDGPVYDGWCTQTCQVDQRWGPCGDACDEDRPANDCACRHFYFTPDCCERPDCVIPEDHLPNGCPTDGELCGFCNDDDDCGGPDDICLEDGHGATFCGVFCAPDAPCPDGYECRPINDYSGNAVTEQCVPLDPEECAPPR